MRFYIFWKSCLKAEQKENWAADAEYTYIQTLKYISFLPFADIKNSFYINFSNSISPKSMLYLFKRFCTGSETQNGF